MSSQFSDPSVHGDALADQRGYLHQEVEAGGAADAALHISNVRLAITLGEQAGWDVASQARLGRMVGLMVCGREGK